MAYEYKPIPPAVKFHDSQKKIRMCVCGAQSGKTRSCLGGELIRDAFFQPGYWQKDIDEGEPYRIMVCEPTFDMIEMIAWALILRALPDHLIVQSKHCKFIRLKGVWGITEIVFKTYEQGSEKAEGSAYYRVYADEFFQMPQTFFDEIIVRTATRKGRIIMSGTPKPTIYLLDMIKKWYLGELKHLDFFTWKTADNPYYPKTEIEIARRTMPPKIFARNFEASLDVFTGQIYDGYDEDIHHVEFELNLDRYMYIIGGQDWGYTHNGVLVIVGITNDGDFDVLEAIAKRGIPVNPPYEEYTGETWVGIAKEMNEKYNLEAIYAGPDEPEHIESYVLNDIFCQAADNAVHTGIQRVMTLMHIDNNNHTRLRLRKGHCDLLNTEIKMYRWKTNKDGTEAEEPLKENDDTVDALRYALKTAERLYSFDEL